MSAFKLVFKGLLGNEDEMVLLEEQIENVRFIYDSPNDVTSKASSSSLTLEVDGKINDTVDSSTLRLINDWVLLEGQEKGAYCTVILTVTGDNERVYREFTLTQAFVVDYEEQYVLQGDNLFKMKIRQRRDRLAETEIAGAYYDEEE